MKMTDDFIVMGVSSSDSNSELSLDWLFQALDVVVNVDVDHIGVDFDTSS